MSILNKLENYLEEHGNSTNPWAGELEHIQAQMKIPANSKEKQPLKHAELLKKWHNINDKYLGHEQDKARKNESVEMNENKQLKKLGYNVRELPEHEKSNANVGKPIHQVWDYFDRHVGNARSEKEAWELAKKHYDTVGHKE